jgi:hypothetical protein
VLTENKSLRNCDSSLARNLIMQSVHNQKNQRPNHFFVRKNEAGMSACVVNFSLIHFESSAECGMMSGLSVGAKRFPLVSSYQSEKPTT